MRIAIALISTITMWAQVSQPTEFRGWMNRGSQLSHNGRYQESLDAFQRAADLKPGDATIHLYLGTAYMQNWSPGADSPENHAMAGRAEAKFKRVLELNPNDTTALASLQSLSFNEAAGLPSWGRIRKLEDAREWNARLLAIDPQDREANYWAGVIVRGAEYYPRS